MTVRCAATAWRIRDGVGPRTDVTIPGTSGRRRSISGLLDLMAPTGSPLEVALLNRVVRRHGLGDPECQAKREGFRVDFCSDAARLIVEVDGTNHEEPLIKRSPGSCD